MVNTYCELYVKHILPAIRALIARELVLNYGFSQWYVAKKLGITQPLVNYYLYGKRGRKLVNYLDRIDYVRTMVKELAANVARDDAKIGSKLCSICLQLRNYSDIFSVLGIKNVDEISMECGFVGDSSASKR